MIGVVYCLRIKVGIVMSDFKIRSREFSASGFGHTVCEHGMRILNFLLWMNVLR